MRLKSTIENEIYQALEDMSLHKVTMRETASRILFIFGTEVHYDDDGNPYYEMDRYKIERKTLREI